MKNETLIEKIRSAQICIPDDDIIYCWYGGGSVNILDIKTGVEVDYFSVSPWFAAKPSQSTVINYIRRKINEKRKEIRCL